MTEKIIECVPNFSEGKDTLIIRRISGEILKVKGVKLADVDAGKDTNRTVFTIIGSPAGVCEAAFVAVKKASELIDMRNHHGSHPRFGATDVCPLVPVSGMTMDEVVVIARNLAKKIGDELGIPVYCYEYAAVEEKRRNLALVRQGEYEGLRLRMESQEWKPDYGPASWSSHVAKTGATAVGARNFLIAYNINLNTKSARTASEIAFEIREKGMVRREGNTLTGPVVKDENGKPVCVPGMFKSVKAIGWYIEQYKIAQVSVNLTDINEAPMHKVFDAACELARARGLRVTGSELVGMAPLKAFIEAGKYFLSKKGLSTERPEIEIVRIAVESLGLAELKPFDPHKKILEYALSS